MKSLLIVLTGSLGDIARGFSLLPSLKKHFPDTLICWLTDEKWQELVQAHPMIDSVIVFQRSRGMRGVFDASRQLSRLRPEVTLDLQRTAKSGFFSLCSRASRRIGFHRKDSKEFNWLFQTESIPPSSEIIPKITQYQEFLIRLGIVPLSPYQFGFDSAASLQLHPDHQLPNNSIALVLGSSWPSKDWPLTGYQELTKLLLQNLPSTIVLLGDSSQQESAQELIKLGSDSRIQSMVGKTSLLALVGIIQQASIVIGPDSGPGHLSAMVGTPYITLFGPTSPLRVAPYGMKDLAVTSPIGCSPCLRRTCPGVGHLCMRLLSPHRVFEIVKREWEAASL